MQAKYRNYTEQIIGNVIMLFVVIVFLVLVMNSCESKEINSNNTLVQVNK